MSKKKDELRPFFANFLEDMEEDQQKRVVGGVTYKYPSDKDEPWQSTD